MQNEKDVNVLIEDFLKDNKGSISEYTSNYLSLGNRKKVDILWNH